MSTYLDEPPLEDNPELVPAKDDRQVPYDEHAELAVIGSMIAWPKNIPAALEVLKVGDFHEKNCQALFAAIETLHREGAKPEFTVLADELRRQGSPCPPQKILEAQSAGGTQIDRNIATLVRLSVSRRVQEIGLQITAQAAGGVTDPTELLGTARDLLGAVDAPLAGGEHLKGLSTVDEFLNTVDTTPTTWVVPGLLRAGWRCLIVAPEGVGKSVAARQIAIASAQGVHPFTHRPIDPVRTLIVDLENPDDAIADTCKPITERARGASARYDEGRAWLWRRPDGINIRTRADKAALEKVIADTQPDLVCLGPLYKAYRATARENDELAAGEVQNTLDDLRTRYGFSLLMEHHAPKSSGLGARDLVPYGSSLWLRWPELGLRLTPGDGEKAARDSLVVGRFRRDRMRNAWPDRLDRGGHGRWPWVGWWKDGYDQEDGQ